MPVKKRKSKVKEVKVGRLIQAPGKGKKEKKRRIKRNWTLFVFI